MTIHLSVAAVEAPASQQTEVQAVELIQQLLNTQDQTATFSTIWNNDAAWSYKIALKSNVYLGLFQSWASCRGGGGGGVGE